MSIVDDAIYNYAKEHHIPMKDGETYGAIHERILESNPKLHTRDELKTFAAELLDKLLDEFGFKATRVFAYYPLISTEEYIGFQEVYLYRNIHDAMGFTTQAFCRLNKILEPLDKKVFQYEFKQVYNERFGFFSLSALDHGAIELIHFMRLLRQHHFDEKYLTLLEEDIKTCLIQIGDKHFHKLDLTNKDNILLLYEVCGIFYGFHEYRFDIFQDYDGYGNVVSCYNKDHVINDHEYLEALVR